MTSWRRVRRARRPAAGLGPAVFRALVASRRGPAPGPRSSPRATTRGGANPVLSCGPGGHGARRRGDGRPGPRADPGRPSGRSSLEVELGGTNPDSTRPADLAEMAWAERVRRQPGAGRPRPRGARRPRLLRARSPASSGPIRGGPTSRSSTRSSRWPSRPMAWLDIGAGAGRYALPLALHVARGRRDRAVRRHADGARRTRRRARDRGRPRHRRALAAAGRVRGGDRARRRRAHRPRRLRRRGDRPVPRRDGGGGRGGCAWRSSWTASRRRSPTRSGHRSTARNGSGCRPSDALVDLLAARGRAPSVARFDRAPRRFASFDDLHGFIRRQLWLAAGGAKDRQLAGLLRATAEERDGSWSVTSGPQTIGVASWRPDGG